MTYHRPPGSWQAAFSLILDRLGRPALAAALGVSGQRVGHLINPMRPDCALLDHAVAADVAAARAGLGTPLLDAYLGRLSLSGVRPEAVQARRAQRLDGAARRARSLLAEGLGLIEAAIQGADGREQRAEGRQRVGAWQGARA